MVELSSPTNAHCSGYSRTLLSFGCFFSSRCTHFTHEFPSSAFFNAWHSLLLHLNGILYQHFDGSRCRCRCWCKTTCIRIGFAGNLERKQNIQLGFVLFLCSLVFHLPMYRTSVYLSWRLFRNSKRSTLTRYTNPFRVYVQCMWLIRCILCRSTNTLTHQFTLAIPN